MTAISRLVFNVMYQLRFTCRQSVKLLFLVAVPYQNLDYYRRYFATVQQVTTVRWQEQQQKKDNRTTTVGLCKVYTGLLLYLALLNLIHLFTPLSHFTRVLLSDLVDILQMDALFYLIVTGLIAYAIFLNHSMYFQMSPRMFAFSLRAFSECPGFIQEGEKSIKLNTLKFANSKKLEPPHNTILGPQNAFFCRLALVVINVLQLFIGILDLGILLFTPALVATLFQQCAHSNLTLGTFLYMPCLFLLLLPLHLLHILFYALFWFSFAHGLILYAALGTSTLSALYLFFGRHHRQLEKAFNAWTKRQKPKRLGSFHEAELHLLWLLRHNAATLFRLVFAFSHFYGRHFLVYLSLHAPTSAYFAVQITFGRVSGFSFLVMLGLVGEAAVGTLFLHLYAAHFTAFIHRSGRLLLRFSAQNSLDHCEGGGAVMVLSTRTRLLVLLHAQRLHVRKQYGITYGGKRERERERERERKNFDVDIKI